MFKVNLTRTVIRIIETQICLWNVIDVHCDTQVTLWGRILTATNYKPGWWALYFVYCAIPIVIYIWYLQKRYREVYLVVIQTYKLFAFYNAGT